MNVEIINICEQSTLSIAETAKKLYPDLKLGKLGSSVTQRLFKKLIRHRDIVLKTKSIMFNIKCPLFVYYEFQSLLANKLQIPRFSIIDSDNIEFDIDEKFSEKHTSLLTCLHKKVKFILKKIDTGSITDEQLLYFLPMSIMISFPLVVDFLELFDILSIGKTHNCTKKMKSLISNIYEPINSKFPELFTTHSIEVYISSKES